jgi:hypothetical protein
MAVPQSSGRQEVKRFNPPAWMLKKAQENAARLGYAPDAFAKKLQKVRETTEAQSKAKTEAQSKANEHATRIQANSDAITNQLAEVRAHAVPVVLTTRPRMAEENNRMAPQDQETPPSQPAEKNTAKEITKLPTTTKQTSAARQAQVKKRDDRRAKKEKSRLMQALLNKKSSSNSPPQTVNDPAMSSIAESSTTGADREGALKASSSLFVSQTVQYPTALALPKWYTNISDTNFNTKKISKHRPPALTSLEALKNCIGRAEIEPKRDKLGPLFDELRDHVHKAEIKLQVDCYILKKARILNPENGLPRIFKEQARFPSDLKADSYHLYKRWLKEDFEQNILRGIVTIKGKDRNGDRIDTAYRSKHPVNAKYYGQGDLVLGQWWPTQLCTVRDGAHGTPQGGIFGEKDKGAYSIVLSGGGYHDKDDGDVIEYSGTDGKNFTPTEVTQQMITSATLGNDIRVIRSSQLQKGKSKYRPQLGLRYDGLYRIMSYELVDKEKQRYQFRLERCPGQHPIRYEENAARRPTIFEVEEFERLRTKIW